MLAEEQEITPHRAALLGTFTPEREDVVPGSPRRLDTVVPQRQDLGRASNELARAEGRELGGGGGGAVFPIQTGVAAANRNARAIASLDVAKEILGACRDDAGKNETAAKFLHIRHHLF